MADVMLVELIMSTHEANASIDRRDFQINNTFRLISPLYNYVQDSNWCEAFLASKNWMPFPAPGEVGKAYVQNVRTAMR